MNAQLRAAQRHYDNACDCCPEESDTDEARADLEALPAFTTEALQNLDDADVAAMAEAVLTADADALLVAVKSARSRYAQFRIDEQMAKHRGEDRAIEELHRAYAGTVNWLGHDLRGRV